MDANPKSEAQISKRFDKLTALSEVEGQIRMTKTQNPKQTQRGTKGRMLPKQPPKKPGLFLSFDHSNFGFVSDLEAPVHTGLKSIRHCLYAPAYQEASPWN
ncbi:MAG: hypothetical protein PVG78_06215 [Desulfobacterales bacterium]|jgi:hypothetical protein